MRKKNTNRETWLNEFAQECVGLFAGAKDMFNFPKGIKLNLNDVRITCGFPPNYRKSQRVSNGNYSAMGVCFPKIKGRPYKHIFILPDWCNNSDIVNLGGVIIHELVHAIDNCKSGHGKAFRLMATAVGLEGKMTATEPSPKLAKWIRKTAKKLGKYPEGQWIHSGAKQTTRMLKVVCPQVKYDCGAVLRMSTKQISEGLPICRCFTKDDLEEYNYLETFEMHPIGYEAPEF